MFLLYNFTQIPEMPLLMCPSSLSARPHPLIQFPHWPDPAVIAVVMFVSYLSSICHPMSLRHNPGCNPIITPSHPKPIKWSPKYLVFCRHCVNAVPCNPWRMSIILKSWNLKIRRDMLPRCAALQDEIFTDIDDVHSSVICDRVMVTATANCALFQGPRLGQHWYRAEQWHCVKIFS